MARPVVKNLVDSKVNSFDVLRLFAVFLLFSFVAKFAAELLVATSTDNAAVTHTEVAALYVWGYVICLNAVRPAAAVVVEPHITERAMSDPGDAAPVLDPGGPLQILGGPCS